MSKPNIDYRNLIRNQFQPKPSRKDIVIVSILILLYVGFLIFHPFSSNEPQYFSAPDLKAEGQTLDEVMAFIRSDETDTMQYGENFNCVNFVDTLFSNASEQGIKSYPVGIVYEEKPYHMVIGFPIDDKGLVLFEPQNDKQIRLEVGQDYDGRKVKGLYYWDDKWVPLDGSPEYDASMGVE